MTARSAATDNHFQVFVHTSDIYILRAKVEINLRMGVTLNGFLANLFQYVLRGGTRGRVKGIARVCICLHSVFRISFGGTGEKYKFPRGVMEGGELAFRLYFSECPQ